MPAKSKKQQKLMGMALAAKRGEVEDPSPKVQELADNMSEKDLKDFAGTNTKDLPQKVEEAFDSVFKNPVVKRTSAEALRKEAEVNPHAINKEYDRQKVDNINSLKDGEFGIDVGLWYEQYGDPTKQGVSSWKFCIVETGETFEDMGIFSKIEEQAAAWAQKKGANSVRLVGDATRTISTMPYESVTLETVVRKRFDEAFEAEESGEKPDAKKFPSVGKNKIKLKPKREKPDYSADDKKRLRTNELDAGVENPLYGQ